jgi:hypothetical protein
VRRPSRRPGQARSSKQQDETSVDHAIPETKFGTAVPLEPARLRISALLLRFAPDCVRSN